MDVTSFYTLLSPQTSQPTADFGVFLLTFFLIYTDTMMIIEDRFMNALYCMFIYFNINFGNIIVILTIFLRTSNRTHRECSRNASLIVYMQLSIAGVVHYSDPGTS